MTDKVIARVSELMQDYTYWVQEQRRHEREVQELKKAIQDEIDILARAGGCYDRLRSDY